MMINQYFPSSFKKVIKERCSLLFTTKHKMGLASLGYQAVRAVRRCFGLGDEAFVMREGINWKLDLREGLDLTIYLTGAFQRKVVQTCLALLPDEGVALDIGANMGAVTLPMAQKLRGKGFVIAIEPTRYPYQRLSHNLDANAKAKARVHLLQAFLTSGGEQRMPEALPSSWRVAGDRQGAHPVHLGVPQSTEGAITLTLDELVVQKNLDRLDLIKIDVDGAEDDVLAGGEATIRRFRPSVVIEVAPYTLLERGLAPDAPLKRLKQLGYAFRDMDGRLMSDTDIRKLTKLLPGQSQDIVAFFQGVLSDQA